MPSPYTVARASIVARALLELADLGAHMLTTANTANIILDQVDQPHVMTDAQYNAVNNLIGDWRQRANTIRQRILSEQSEP
jgi:hypothetical protein